MASQSMMESSPSSTNTTGSDLSIDAKVAADRWDAYITGHAHGSIYHQSVWDAPFRVYGLRVQRIAAVRGERIVGGVALVKQHDLFLGRRTVSLPWFDRAGILTDDDPARERLLAAALESARHAKSNELHLRQSEDVTGWAEPSRHKVLMRLALPSESESLWKGFSPKVRNQVRKGEKAGLEYHCGAEELLDEFYGIYATNMRDLGSPPHSRKFMRAVIESLGSATNLHVIRLHGETIGGGLTIDDGDRCDIPWASSLRKYNSLCVNHVLYWNLLKRATDEGRAWFHFGRSTVDSGTYRFKKQWGAEPDPLSWYSFLPDGTPMADLQRPEESFGLARQIWQKLPTPISTLLGPQIIRKVP